MRKGIFIGFLLSNSFLVAQGVVGSGYTAPTPVSVAPGQIATFYVSGLTSLTGITATIQQQSASIPAPVQSVRSVSLCPDNLAGQAKGCGSLTAVTVQIPYELIPICPLCAAPIVLSPPAALLISQNGQAGTAIELNPLADQVHVLTTCDVVFGPVYPLPPNTTGLPCAPVVTHANGSIVTATNPASAGEELVAWVFGLGQTNPAAATGQPAAKSVPTVQTFSLDFNYQINALPTKPFTGDPDRVPQHPIYTGLSADYVGLYQVNFIVPPGPANGLAHCSVPGSNLTVSIGGQFSFDGTGICVATQIPVD